MKTILFTICVLMAIHAYAGPTERPASYYDSVEVCFKNITHKNETISSSINVSKNIPKHEFNELVNASICAFKMDGIITPEGTLTTSKIDEYCTQVLVNSKNVKKCQKIVKRCTRLACGDPECTSTEIKPYIECAIKHKILSILEFPL